MEAGERSVVLIVMESGNAWPAWVERIAGQVGHTMVVAQQADCPPAELALKVIQKISALSHSDRSMVLGVIAAGAHAAKEGDDVFAARCLVARAMFTHMAAVGCGSVVFSCPDDISSEAKRDLFGLVETLTGQLRGSELSVGLRFDGSVSASSSRRDEAQRFAAAS